MSTFLAIRKKSRVGTERPLRSLSVGERRSRLVTSAPSAEIADELTWQGFQQDTREAPIDEQAPTFQHLNGIDAYVLNTLSEQQIERARDTFAASSYQLVPDIQLYLPQPISGARRHRPSGHSPWPVACGIGEARRNGVTGEGVLVGVLDTGCDADHGELSHKPIAFRYIPQQLARDESGRDNSRDVRGFDVHGHGTHVCGILAGQNVGVAPRVDLMVASVIERETLETSLVRIAKGLDWMISQFQREENLRKPAIVSMSLGFRPEWIASPERRAVMDSIRGLLSNLFEDFDVLPIVAIGNDGAGTMRAPGYFPETLSVGAVDVNHVPADFSGGGSSPIDGKTQPNIVGYGVNVYSSLERDWNNTSIWQRLSGTSMATPYVAGIAALYASVVTTLESAALRQHLLDTALRLQAPAERVGAGLARFT